MNHKRRDIRGHTRRNYFGSYKCGKLNAKNEEEKQTQTALLRIVQASQIGVVLPMEDQRA